MVQCVGWEYNDPSIVACWIRDGGISCNFWCKNTYKNDWNRGFARGISSKCPFTQVWQLWFIIWFSTDTDLIVHLRYTSGKTSLWMILWSPNLPKSAWSTLVNQWFLAEIPRHWFMSFHGGNSCCTTVQGVIETNVQAISWGGSASYASIKARRIWEHDLWNP